MTDQYFFDSSGSVDRESDEEEAMEPVMKQPKVKTKDIKSFFSAPSSTKKSSKPITSKPKKNIPVAYPKALKSLNLKRTKHLL